MHKNKLDTTYHIKYKLHSTINILLSVHFDLVE